MVWLLLRWSLSITVTTLVLRALRSRVIRTLVALFTAEDSLGASITFSSSTSIAGPSFADRCELYNYIVEELRNRQHLNRRIGKAATALTNQRDDLLAFAQQLDDDLQALADEFKVAPTVVRQVLQMQAMDMNHLCRWQQQAQLQEQLGSSFYPLSEAAICVAERTVRASSVIENFNSRLRSYFFLRRNLGSDYLQLLQFFLNHRRFLRSRRPERVNKSPIELLTGETHPHWLESLGYEPFSAS